MATASAGVYRPRHPERTVLYGVFAQHFERFVQLYDEHFAPRRGPLPPGAQEAVNRYLDCGIFACGFARVRCSDCGHDYFVALTCYAYCTSSVRAATPAWSRASGSSYMKRFASSRR